MKLYKDYIKHALVIGTMACAASITACGGSSSPAAAPTLSGTAAAGAPIIGTVTAKGSLGNTKSALIEANGNYNVDVTGLTAPYRLRAVGTVGGRTYKLHSFAEEADVGGNVNITPFTDLIVANAANQIAESFFDSNTPVDITTAELDAQEDALQAKLQNVFNALGLDTAINLLNSTFSADHTGLDAALDIVNIEVDPILQVATITNLIESTTLDDSIVDPADAGTLAVNNATALTDAVSDTQQIAALFDNFTAAFVGGLPTAASIEDFFTVGFLEIDQGRSQFLTEITTDPSLVGLMFSGVSVEITSATTATVDFNFGINGVLEPEVANWFAVKDATLGWQLQGDNIPADYWFNFHCNDNDGDGGFAGACGVNTMIEDNDFTNNGTGGAEFASATVSIFSEGDDTTTATPKAVIHLGTPIGSSAGSVQVYNAGTGFQGDWKPFGTTGITADVDIDPALFVGGEIIKYDLYTEALDITDPNAPAIEALATPAFTFTRTSVFAASTTALYPSATAATKTAINGFTLGNDLTIAWTLATGTSNDEVLVRIDDGMGNDIETWIETFGTTATSQNFASTLMDSTAANSAGLDQNALTYNLLVRIYARDETTGQNHSRDYTATIDGPGATPAPPPATGLACGYESGWDDLAGGGMGAPINPNSFAEYEEQLTSCFTPQSFTAVDVAGSSFSDFGEITTFNVLATAGTAADPGTGVFDDGAGFIIDFTWYIEDATCAGCQHSYLVLEADATANPILLPAGFWLRETSALTGITGTGAVTGDTYDFHKYSEQSNYSDTNRATGSDAEIWHSTDTLQ